MPRKWSKEIIIAEILRQQASGSALSSQEVMKKDAQFYFAVVYYYKSWGRAVRAAGIEYKRPNPTWLWTEKKLKWTRETIIATIRSLVTDGAKVNMTALKKHNHQLVITGLRLFGSWEKMITAAGFRPEDVNPRYKLSPEMVIKQLAARAEQGKSLMPGDVSREDSLLRYYANKHFGNLGSAVKKAGLDPDLVCRKWSKAKVIQALKERQKSGLSMSIGAIRKDDCALNRVIDRYFGGYTKVKGEIGGIETNKWTTEKIKQEIAIRCYQHGKSMRIEDARRDNAYLISVAEREFGSWRKAVKAALGFCYKEWDKNPRTRWTKDLVLEKIKIRHKKGKSLTTKSVRKEDLDLLYAAIRKFGSWENALFMAQGGNK